MAEAQSPEAPASGQDAVSAEIARLEATLPELNPQRTDTGEQSPTQAPPSAPATTEQPTPSTDVLEPDGAEHTDDEGPEPGTEQPQQQPTSRMGRLRQQLAQAEDRALQLQHQLQNRDNGHSQALREFVDLVLPDAQFEHLRVQAESGDWEAKQRLDQARAWRRMIVPVAETAHLSVQRQFDHALADLRTLDGMDAEAHQKVVGAQTPGEKLKMMWELARKVSDQQHKERISALETEVQSLKTNRAANGAQPATGGAPRTNGASGLAGLVGKNGQLTDEAMQLTPQQIRERFGLAH